MNLGRVLCWLVLGFGCARGAEDQPDGRAQFDVFPSDRPMDQSLDRATDQSLDRATDQTLDRASDTASESTGDAGACLSVRRTRTYQSSGNTTASSVLFDRGFSPNSTSVCPLSVAPTDVTSDSPAQLFKLCNQESTSMTFSLEVEAATYDVWVAAYTGDEVPANPQQCLVMNDDDRRNPNISTTNAFIPSLTIPAGGVVTLVITGITREQSGPFDLTLTPL